MKPMWKTGLTSSMCAKWPGHSWRLPAQVMHRLVRSIVPCRGSMSPPSFGLPFSYTSAYLISPTDMPRYKLVHSVDGEGKTCKTDDFIGAENAELASFDGALRCAIVDGGLLMSHDGGDLVLDLIDQSDCRIPRFITFAHLCSQAFVVGIGNNAGAISKPEASDGTAFNLAIRVVL